MDAAIILTIVLVSGLLGFWQEKGAAAAVAKLLAIVQIKVTVLHDGRETEIALQDLLLGDIVLLKAGCVIPADCLLLESDNLFVDEAILTGPEIAQMSGRALLQKVAEVNLFAEIEPNQKERIIIALKKAGFVVGYMGDGINDASALHAADVGISVDSAADIAKDSWSLSVSSVPCSISRPSPPSP